MAADTIPSHSTFALHFGGQQQRETNGKETAMSRDYMIDGDRVEAGTSTLMRQAQMTAHDYMAQARHDIDEVFGERYAISHPELIAAYMQTAALDFGAAV